MQSVTPSPKVPLSVVIICQNEASTIVPCLDSVADLADEIVALDSGSVDGTQAVCTARGVRVIEETWRGFGKTKQLAVELARNDWVLCLDADERLTPELAANIRQALAAPQFAAYRFARANRFLGRYLRHGEGYPDWCLRLFDRRQARWSDDEVHEKVLCTVPVGVLAGDLLHDSAESLENYLNKQNRYTSLAAGMADTAEPVSAARLVASPFVRFVKFYFLRGGFRDGLPGLVHIVIGCFNSFIKYAKMIERQRGKSTQ